MDANGRYWQAGISKRDRDETMFPFHNNLFHSTGMPFVFENSQRTLYCVMDVILTKAKAQFVLDYLEDVVVFLQLPDEHIDNVHRFPKLLHDSGVALYLSIC